MQSVRRIRVGYTVRRGSELMLAHDAHGEVIGKTRRTVYAYLPDLRLRGQWLVQAGFDVGNRVRVAVADGCLVITPEGGSDR